MAVYLGLFRTHLNRRETKIKNDHQTSADSSDLVGGQRSKYG